MLPGIDVLAWPGFGGRLEDSVLFLEVFHSLSYFCSKRMDQILAKHSQRGW